MTESYRRLIWLVLLVAAAACTGRSTPAVGRPECQPFFSTLITEDVDKGPCAPEGSPVDGEPWTLSTSWVRRPREGGTPGDGPCISMLVSTGKGPNEKDAAGAAWCDIPEGRLIGEWISRKLSPATSIAWGPVSAGSISQVRIDFSEGPSLVLAPKPTPWSEFDYWFATFVTDRKPSALVALDSGGAEVAREDVAGRPPDPEGSQGPGRGPRPSPTATPVVGISAGKAREIANREVKKDWFLTEGVQDPQNPVVRLTRFPSHEVESGGVMIAPDLRDRYAGKLVWAVQVEGEARPVPESTDRSGRDYYFHGVYLDLATGEVLARYASVSKPLFYPALLRTGYSAECTNADPIDGLPPLDPAIALEIAKDRLKGRPAGPNGGTPDFSIADASLIACVEPDSSGRRPALYWLVTVPAEVSLARCGPVVTRDTQIGATCWSGHTYIRVHGAIGSVSIGPQVGNQGPLLSDLELSQVAKVAAAEGWWKVWAVLQGHYGVRPPAAFTYALAAHELESGVHPSSGVTFPFGAGSIPRTYPSVSPRDDPANWAAQGSIAVIVVGRVTERTGTFAVDRGLQGTESYGLWRVDIEQLVDGRLPNNGVESATVRFSDPGPLVRFPIPPPATGARAVIFLEPAFSMGDPARALDLQPSAIPGMNGVVKIEGDRIRHFKGETPVEETLSRFLERVNKIREELAGKPN